MLILTRKLGETIVVNDNVRIKIVGIRGGQVRLLIEAPIEIPVHREEIWDKIQLQKNSSKLSLVKS